MDYLLDTTAASTSQDPLAWLDELELQNSSETTTSSPYDHSSNSPGDLLSSPSNRQQSTQPTSSKSSLEHDEGGYASSSSSSSAGSSHQAKKARIALDPAQPPTARGNARVRVYVACHECRSRKIRCDGAKPVCFNCHRRDSSITSCNYDSAPKRRGQDKVPGSRIRYATGQRVLRHIQPQRPDIGDFEAADGDPDPARSGQGPGHRGNHGQLYFEDILQGFDPASFDASAPQLYELPTPPGTDVDRDEEEDQAVELAVQIAAQPSIQFARETWWDALLTLYAGQYFSEDPTTVGLTAERRITTTQRVFADLRATLRSTIYWASFLHLPRLFETLLNPTKRTSLQPSLLLSMLAVGAFAQGSELKDGAKGRRRALVLVEQAHAALQASLVSNWVDIGLVQAAWFINYLEMQGHPEFSHDRGHSALLLLDSLIRLLSLTKLDADVPNAQYSIFAKQTEITVNPPVTSTAPFSAPLTTNMPSTVATSHVLSRHESCSCDKYTLKQQWPTVVEIAPLWETTTMWPNELSEGEIRKEEARRVVWSSVLLAAGHNGFKTAYNEVDADDMFIKDYQNYALLFPGDVITRSGVAHLKQDTVWNLALRATLLWHTSVRYRTLYRSAMDTASRARIASGVWLEADAIEAALNKHTCKLEEGMLHQAREYLFTSRMCVSYEFQQFVPEVRSTGIMSVYREKAEVWLRTQKWVIDEIWNTVETDPHCELLTRPLLVYWFLGHIARALIIHKTDPTLVFALEAAKSFTRPLEYMMRVWPNDNSREKWQQIRYDLVQSCLKAGISPPTAELPRSLFEIRKLANFAPQPGLPT